MRSLQGKLPAANGGLFLAATSEKGRDMAARSIGLSLIDDEIENCKQALVDMKAGESMMLSRLDTRRGEITEKEGLLRSLKETRALLWRVEQKTESS